MDLRFQARGAVPPRAPVVIVAIDEESFREIGVRWPWPRSCFARAVDRIAADGAAAVGLDLMLADRGYAEEEDLALAEAMGRAGNVVIPAKFETGGAGGYTTRSLQLPLALFAGQAAAVGYVNLLQGADGFVRSFKPAERFQDELVFSFPLAVLATSRGGPPEDSGGEAAAGVSAPASVWDPGAAPLRGGALLVNFAGPPGTFPAISFHRVMAGDFEPGTFRGRIALIGAWYRESNDLFPTPFFHAPAGGTGGGGAAVGGGAGMYGVEVHANALDTLFSGRYIRPWTWRQNALFMALLALCGSLALVSLSPLRGLGAVAALAGVLVLVIFTLFSRGGRWVHLSEPLFILGFSYTGSVFYRYFTEERENRLIRGLFSRYVSQQVVAQLLSDPGRVRLGGETRDVVIFFCDIRGFTSLTERTGPEEVVGMLNDFYREMTEVIFKYEGTVNKYIGDALLAFYGAPIAHDDDAGRAVLACLEMRDRLEDLNRERASLGKEPIAAGMGVHRGPVVVGNVGSPRRMEYTAIGDPVNTCQRVESLTRQLGAGILITEQVYREVSGLVEVRTFDPVAVKGKREPLHIYEVLGLKGGRLQ